MSNNNPETDPETVAIRRIWQAAGNMKSSTQARVARVFGRGSAAVEEGSAAGVSATVVGLAAAGQSLAKYAGNLDWTTIDPSKFVDAGTRGAGRTLEEARLVWESIPERLRALGPDEIERQLEGFDWSHIVPFSKGGGNEAANGIFELAELNQERGAEPMTAAELDAASKVLLDKAFDSALQEAAANVLTGAVMGAAVTCVISCFEFGLDYQRGKITQEELHRKVCQEVAKSTVVGGSVAGILATVALAFPALIPVAAPLVMPLVVLGMCAVGYKIVRLGKEWVGFIRECSEDSSVDALPNVIFLPSLMAPE